MNAYDGYWQYAGKKQMACGDCPANVMLYAFRLEDETVTLRLLQFAIEIDGNADGYYRLHTRWNGDSLEYRSTTGRWTPFMRKMDGLLVCGNAGEVITFAKIDVGMLDQDEVALTQERPVYVYED